MHSYEREVHCASFCDWHDFEQFSYLSTGAPEEATFGTLCVERLLLAGQCVDYT